MTNAACSVRSTFLLLFGAVLVYGQSSQSDQTSLQKLFPPKAKIIETADLQQATGKPREFVLWMEDPARRVRRPDQEYCGDAVYGDYWEGPSRLSVVNTSNGRLVNTVDLGDFSLPFRVAKYYYVVPKIDAKGEGKPKILYLQDLTGDGVAAEFILSMYLACGITGESVLGYDPLSDKAVQYRIEILGAEDKPETVLWLEQVFWHLPTTPGNWDFTWDPGHGAEAKIHTVVNFDKAKGVFVSRENTVPYK